MIKIITDSSSNITREEAAKLGIEVLPLTIIFGNEQFRDGIDIDCDTFYSKMRTSREFPHTAQLTEEQIEPVVLRALKQADEVLILPIASALSGSYERCKAVADRYENVYAYDTKSTTVMLKSMVLEALAHAGEPAKKVIEILDGYRPKLKIFAALDTLENLKKGGRLPGAVAFIGSMLKIKPVITFSQDGKVQLISKQFGISKSINYVAQKVDKNKIDFSKPVYLIYTGNESNSVALAEKLGIDFSEKANICPVIGAHIGEGGAGIVFAEK